MVTLALLHRWAGGIVGLILAVIGLSGAILVWEDSWIGVPHAGDRLNPGIPALARSVEAARAASSEPLARITFADEGLGVHQAVYADGSGAYLSQSGEVVSRWMSEWERPELWLFSLHHHFFLGHTGETIAGITGVFGLFFIMSGMILWWRTRSTFRFRLWPARMTRSAIVRQHRDLGIVAAPVLAVTLLTGVLMIFNPLAALSQKTSAATSPPQNVSISAPRDSATAHRTAAHWEAALRSARERFPGATLRRLQFPKDGEGPVVFRMKQQFEWTPNGRTYIRVDPSLMRIISVDDPARRNGAQSIEEKFYPIHAAKVGGVLWKAAATVSGLTLAMLGSFAVYSFWFLQSRSGSFGRSDEPIAI